MKITKHQNTSTLPKTKDLLISTPEESEQYRYQRELDGMRKYQQIRPLEKLNSSELGKTLDWVDLGLDVVSMLNIPYVSSIAGVAGTVTGFPQAYAAVDEYLGDLSKVGAKLPTLDQTVAMSKIIPTGGLWAKAAKKAWLAKDGFVKGVKGKKLFEKWIPNGINLAADEYEILKNKNGGSMPKLNSGGDFQQLVRNLILNNNRFPSVVGGISYNSINNNKPVDIYGEQIDLESLVPYFHSPVHIEESIPSGYQKQYNFENPKEDNVPETPTLIVSDTPAQTTTPVVPTVPVPVVSTENTPKTKTTTKLTGKEGFKQLVKLYESALEKRGIDKSYAKWLASKDALETGWGLQGHGAEHLNYGNITAGSNWSGKTYEGGDHDAKGNKIRQKFRAYDAIEDYIEDQLNLYNLERYKDVFVGNVSEFADRLYKAGYAEDPEYAKKIKSVYNSW